MTNTIYIIPIEPIENRYTKFWYRDIPNILQKEAHTKGKNYNIVTIDGETIPDQTTKGAFLDFGYTNVYKGSQTVAISKLFAEGQVQPGDKFLVTDAWNFITTAIIYMSELLDVPVEIHGIWEAGAHDPSDILGFKVGKDWSFNQERAWFYACDKNYFASDFHRKLFLENLNIPQKDYDRAIRSSHPSIHLQEECQPFQNNQERSNTIVFTHRLNQDKQPEIFRDLVKHLPKDFDYVITQDQKLNKQEYFEMMSKSKIVFSCSLHENYGYGQLEGTMCGCLPVVPDRASYSEIYLEPFKYPSKWTEDYDYYLKHRNELVDFVTNIMYSYDELRNTIYKDQVKHIVSEYTYPKQLVDNLI